MTETFRRFDAAEFLDDEEDVAAYFQAAVEDADPAAVITALGTIARARNMSQIARDAGLTREGLYKALSPDGNPGFSTVSRIAAALGFGLSFARIGVVGAAAKVPDTALTNLRRSARKVFISHGPEAMGTILSEPPAGLPKRSVKPPVAAKAEPVAHAKPKAAGVRSRRSAQTPA